MKSKYYHNIILMTFALSAVLQISSSAAAQCRIRLRPSVQITAGPVTFKDIAYIDSADADFCKRLESMIITQVQTSGHNEAIDVFMMTRILADAGINPAGIDIYGASVCRLSIKAGGEKTSESGLLTSYAQPASTLLEPTSAQKSTVQQSNSTVSQSKVTLGDKLIEQVVRSTGYPIDRLVIDWDCRDAELLHHLADARRYIINPKTAITLGRIRFEVIDTKAPVPPYAARMINYKQPKKSMYVNGTVKYFCQSIVATRNLSPGEIILAGDLQFKPQLVTDLSRIGVQDVSSIIGFQVARTIRAKQVILGSMIKRRILIKRNDYIDVVTQVGYVRVTNSGVAMADGAAGDMIPIKVEFKQDGVKRKSSSTVLYGKITARGIVSIVNDPAPEPVERLQHNNQIVVAGSLAAGFTGGVN